jgi:hypothetical protein
MGYASLPCLLHIGLRISAGLYLPPCFCFFALLLRKPKAVKQSKANLGVYLGVA